MKNRFLRLDSARCRNGECPIRSTCGRFFVGQGQARYATLFVPSRLADGKVSCGMRIEVSGAARVSGGAVA